MSAAEPRTGHCPAAMVPIDKTKTYDALAAGGQLLREYEAKFRLVQPADGRPIAAIPQALSR
jgi:hypothetical protein